MTTKLSPPLVGAVAVPGVIILCREIPCGRAGLPLFFVRMRADAAVFGFEPCPPPGTPSALVFFCMTAQAFSVGDSITFDLARGPFAPMAQNLQAADSPDALFDAMSRFLNFHGQTEMAAQIEQLAAQYHEKLVGVGAL